MSEENIEISVEDESTEKNYFTTIPNIIFDMGIGVYAIAYYSLLKRTAGDKGKCFKRKKTIAQQLGCSERQLQYLNKFLSQPFAILNGKPLIRIKEQKRDDGSKTANLITLVDIWRENNEVIASGKDVPQTPFIKLENVEKGVPAHGAGGSSTISARARAPHAPHKEEHSTKEEHIKEVVYPRVREENKSSKLIFRSSSREKPVESIELDFVYQTLQKENYSKEEIDDAIKIAKENDPAIRPGCAIKYIKAIIDKQTTKQKQERKEKDGRKSRGVPNTDTEITETWYKGKYTKTESLVEPWKQDGYKNIWA